MKTFSFIKNQKIFFGIAIVMFVVGIVSFFTLGFNMDIDFVGGSEITYDLGKTVTPEDEAVIEDMVSGIIGDKNFSSIRVADDSTGTAKNSFVIVRTLLVEDKKIAAELKNTTDSITSKVTELYTNASLSETDIDGVLNYTLFDMAGAPANWLAEDATAITDALAGIKAKNLSVSIDSVDASVLNVTFDTTGSLTESRAEITKAITEKYPNAVWSKTDSVSAEISEGLRQSAILATGIAVVLMLAYIAFRFQISSAFAAIVCLVHDLFIMLVAYSIFQIPVNSNIIAALLTILGYSINATIIIFDRVRENDKNMPAKTGFEDKIDNGIKATLWRSVNTTLTTLFTIGMIYILGVTSIKNFALPLIVGIIAGLFSSVCLSGPLWNLFKNIGKKIKNKK